MNTLDCSRRGIVAGFAGLTAAAVLPGAASASETLSQGTEAYEDDRSRRNLPIPYALPVGRAYLSGGALRLDSRRSGSDRIYWHCNGAHRTYNFDQGSWQIVQGGIREGKRYEGVLFFPMKEHRAVVTTTAAHDESTPLSFRVGISGASTGMYLYFTDLSGEPINLKTTKGLNLVLSNSRNLWISIWSVGPRSN